MIKIIYAMIPQTMEEGFEDNLCFAPGEYEMMMFDDAVLIEVNGTMQPFPAHHCILYRPGQHVHYRAVQGQLTYNWIRFDCDEPLFTEGYVPFGVPVFCPDYHCYLEYWKMVANENYWNHPSSSLVIESLMHIIFHRLHDYACPPESSGRYRQALVDLRAEIYQHPEYDWTLEYMAEELHISIRTLQKEYKTFAHTSCTNEVIESRLSHAKTRLMRTPESIQDVALHCGYRNTEHFCRQFKKHVGLSPNQYRKLHKQNNETSGT